MSHTPDTHWTRILYCDIFSGDRTDSSVPLQEATASGRQAPGTGKGTRTSPPQETMPDEHRTPATPHPSLAD
ncbi:MAG: hypothetical protein ABI624_03060 [Casimicrobiaceae bacterium]